RLAGRRPGAGHPGAAGRGGFSPAGRWCGPHRGPSSEVLAVLRSLRQLFGRLGGDPAGRAPAGAVLLWVLRGCFGALIIGLAMLAFTYFSRGVGGAPDPSRGWVAFFGILGLGVLVVATA